MTQPFHYWAYTEKTIIEKSHVPLCSLRHYLQEPGHGSNLDVNRWMDKEVGVHMCNGILLIHLKE